MLLIEDRHASHITIDVIELAHKNDIHLLCLPAHTSHILQPLDIGVFKSFKPNYSKACRKYMMDNPGQVIMSEVIASLVGNIWPNPISPLNPGEVSNRMLTPAKVLKPVQSSPSFSDEQVELYKKRFVEGYDLHDPQYEMWLKPNHLEGLSSSDADSLQTHISESVSTLSPSCSS